MRIIVCNNRYFRSSGPETYLFGLEAALKARGHAVHPFAMRLPQNESAPDADLFVDPPGAIGAYRYKDYAPRLSLAKKISAGVATMYSLSARRKFDALLDRVQPDIVYALNITNFLTPSIVYAARARGVPVVARFSDYSLSCSSYGYFRDGHPCFECRGGLLPALQHRCVQGSLAVTALRVGSIQLHRWLGYLRSLQAAIAPSRFQEQDLLRLGAPRERVHFVPTPMWDLDRITPVTSAPPTPTPTVAFVGRLSPEKGLEFLLRAWPQVDAPARLIVIGEGSEADAGSRVDFVGPRFGADLYQTLAGCDVVVVPSLFPDNSPNVVIEAMALGKPIVATRIGGIPDQVDADCALLVEPWDVAGLARNINALLSDTAKRVQMGEHARARAGSVFHPTLHLDRLEMIFHAAIAGAR